VNINRKLLSLISLLLILSFNFVGFTNNSFLSNLYLFLFIIIIPGLLLVLSFKIRLSGFWEYLVYSVGASIGYLMFLGLFINNTLPFFNIPHPLSEKNIITSVNISLVLLSITSIIKNPRLHISNPFKKIKRIDFLFLFFSPLFVLLSIGGANMLNNTGLNYLTMIMLGGIGLYLVLLTLFYKKTNSSIYPFIAYVLSLSLLLMLSLRSNHITGWDINNEFKVFQLTKSTNIWDINKYKDAYNACLSITILPTIFSFITKLNNEYIYKLFYQIIFAFVPTILYLILKRYVKEIFALFSVIYLISQPLFIQPMAALVRQEVGMLFFGLMLLSLLDKKLSSRKNKLLFSSFGIMMAVSHYATTYVALILFIVTYILLKIINIKKNSFILFSSKKIELFRKNKDAPQLSLIPIIIVTTFTILWYGFITHTSDNFVDTTKDTITNLKDVFTVKAKSQEVSYSMSFLTTPNTNTMENLKKYEDKYESIFSKSQNVLGVKTNQNGRYAYDDYKNYPLFTISSRNVNPILNTALNKYVITFFQLIKLLAKAFLILGIIFVFFTRIRRKFNIDFIGLTLVSISLLALMLLHPTLSLHYNISRLYLQLLIILAIFATFGGLLFFSFLKKDIKKIYAVGIFFSTIFLLYTGFIPQFIGGPAFMHLNNYGEDYDKYYTHDTEKTAAIWLGKNRDIKSPVFADAEANLRLQSTLYFNANNVIIPSVIPKNAYVYAGYANVIQKRADASLDGTPLIYNYPIGFLSTNKNIVYNNGGSAIYK